MNSVEKTFSGNRTADQPIIGDRVRIVRSMHSPYTNRPGVISAIDPGDAHGMYLVEFDDGLRFRYGLHELHLIENSFLSRSIPPGGLLRELLGSLF
jgi:hypothetical protein